jgi:hypothetical protein
LKTRRSKNAIGTKQKWKTRNQQYYTWRKTQIQRKIEKQENADQKVKNNSKDIMFFNLNLWKGIHSGRKNKTNRVKKN